MKKYKTIENTVTTDDPSEAEKLAKKGVDVNLVDNMDEDLEEGKTSKFLAGLAIVAGLLGVGQINKSDKILKAIDAKIEFADTKEEKNALKKLANERLIWLDVGKGSGGDISLKDVNSVVNESLYVRSLVEWGIHNKKSTPQIKEIIQKIYKK